jgi:hypothetical protein
MASIICPTCKHELNEYTRFCPECGARLPDPEPQAPGAAATVVLPPATAAPTVVLPPGHEQAPPSAAPTARLDAPPPAQQPAYGPPPAGAPYPTDQGGKSAGRRTLMWALVGGAGCLSLILVGVCALGVLTLLGQRVETVFPTTVAATPAAGGIVPEDAPLVGGDVLFEDDFDDPDASALGADEDPSSRYAFEDGAYVVAVKEPETIVWARVDGTYRDARVSVDAEVPPGADVASAGVIFHYQDPDNFYLFSVTNDGYYMLELLENNDWIVLIDSTQSDAIDATRNRLRVEMNGDRISLYVNDQLLETTSDGTFGDGEVALAVTSLADSTAEVRFDNLLIERNE